MPQAVAVQKISEILNVTPRRVQQLAEEGMPKQARGLYDPSACALWYIRYLQRELERRGATINPDETGGSLRAQKERLTKAQADRAERNLAQQTGELVSIIDVRQFMAMNTLTMKQQLMGIPSRIAAQLEGETRITIKVRLDQAIKGALTSLSNEFKQNGYQLTDTGPEPVAEVTVPAPPTAEPVDLSGETPGAASGPEDQRVG